MADGATEILDALMRNMREIISTKTIVGDPIQNGNITILPVMKVSVGFGAGAGSVSGSAPKTDANDTVRGGGGGGGGIAITPVGFLVVDENRALMITPKASKWEWLAESIPDLLERLTKMKKGSTGKKDGGTGEKEGSTGEPSANSDL